MVVLPNNNNKDPNDSTLDLHLCRTDHFPLLCHCVSPLDPGSWSLSSGEPTKSSTFYCYSTPNNSKSRSYL